MVLRRLSFWLALAGILLTIATLWGARGKPTPPPPMEAPPQNPYPVTVAAAGIIEAVNENVRIAPPVPGLVTKVYVKVADHVEQGDPLVQLDDRELRAQWQTRTDSLPSAAALIAEQQIRLRDAQDQLKRLQSVTDRRAVSEDDVQRKWHEAEGAKRALIRARADLHLAQTERDEVQALINRLTVRAPRKGTILQVNIRAGEYATVNAIEPLILLGDTETLQVRADIDEVNAPLVVPGSPAVAYLKGYTDESIPLTFDRIEPYIVPKRSLTGDNRERVDTRVLQVIYRFDKPSFPVYVGQQVDVYIERSDNPMQDQENGTPDLGIQQSKHSPTLLPKGENRGRGTHE
jgi:HlyD family secretion protein